MLVIESLQCNLCHEQCKDFLRFADIHTMCLSCGQMVCKKCKPRGTRKCQVGNDVCQYPSPQEYPEELLAAASLAAFASPEETANLDFSKWNPFICFLCQDLCEDEGLRAVKLTEYSNCVQQGQITFKCENMSKCNLRSTIKKVPFTVEQLGMSVRCTKILRELRNCFSKSAISQSSRDGVLGAVLLSTAQCQGTCGRMQDQNLLSASGEFVCQECYNKSVKPDLIFRDFDAKRYTKWGLYSMFPSAGELKSLTYATWTPFRCGLCSVPFDDTRDDFPMYHPDCKRICCSKCCTEKRCCDGTSNCMRARFMLRYANVLSQCFGTDGREELRRRKAVTSSSCVSLQENKIVSNGGPTYTDSSPGKESEEVIESSGWTRFFNQMAIGWPNASEAKREYGTPDDNK